MRDLDTRRAVLNAVVTGTLDRLDLPAHVVSWHLIWLHHGGRIQFAPDGTPREVRAAA